MQCLSIDGYRCLQLLEAHLYFRLYGFDLTENSYFNPRLDWIARWRTEERDGSRSQFLLEAKTWLWSFWLSHFMLVASASFHGAIDMSRRSNVFFCLPQQEANNLTTLPKLTKIQVRLGVELLTGTEWPQTQGTRPSTNNIKNLCYFWILGNALWTLGSKNILSVLQI